MMGIVRLRRSVWSVILVAFSVACALVSPAPAGVGTDAAQEALSTFLGLLAIGDYEQAAALYGGPIEPLQVWNPEIDPQEIGALLEYGCESRLLQCLPVRSIVLVEAAPGGSLVFNVEFSLPDGSLFVRGPCCGATSTEMPDQSLFPFRVQRMEGGFVVLDLPPYVP